ncbi:MAG TPA: oligosaccharide flippase family protein [Vicinamibacterales bacterium]|nr:oligosaccharide flippase family protein [Vicinamibacterales bacterium]
MRESRRRAALATLAGTSLTVTITIAQAVVLIPLCLRALGAHLYGAWLGASELLVWIQMLDGGIPNLLTQRVGAAIGRGDRTEAARWSITGLVLVSAIGGLLAAIGLTAAPFVARWAQVESADVPTFIACFRVGAAASALLLCANGFVGIARGVQRTEITSASQVAGALAGLVTSVVLILAGWKLWALALGLAVRGVIVFAGGFAFSRQGDRALWQAAPSMTTAREIGGLAPSMVAGSVGYVLATNSEIVLVTTVFGPVAAAVYALTRRAIDGLRSLLDSIAFAVNGGFAHLVAAADRHRARVVLHEMLWIRLALASLAGAIAIAVNRPFVTLLFGSAQFGGVWLTAAFVAQMVIGGQSFLANYLLRAAGQVRQGSWLLAAEAAARAGGIAVGLQVLGLIGAPLSTAVVSTVGLFVNLRRLGRTLPPGRSDAFTRRAVSDVAPVAVLTVGVLVGLSALPLSWFTFFGAGAAVGGMGLLVLWRTRPAPSTDGVALLRWGRRASG